MPDFNDSIPYTYLAAIGESLSRTDTYYTGSSGSAGSRKPQLTKSQLKTRAAAKKARKARKKNR
jgi:hypothetical protein